MEQINLFKIEHSKMNKFMINLKDKNMSLIGKRECISNNNTPYFIEAYLERPKNGKEIEWRWILELFGENGIEQETNPRAILVINDGEDMYVATYGMSYFLVDKFCDVDFAFEIGRRLNFKSIKTTTMMAPNSPRNKTVNVYLNYDQLDFDSGESYAKIKAKLNNPENFTIHSDSIEIGHSIRTGLPDTVLEQKLEGIVNFIDYLKEVGKRPEKYKIPVFMKEKDKEIVKNLDATLFEKLDHYNDEVGVSELEIVGVNETFNGPDNLYTLKCKGYNDVELSDLNMDSVLQYIQENNIYSSDIANIQVMITYPSGYSYPQSLKNLITYTDEETRRTLIKGVWYRYNEDYMSYLRDSIYDIDTEYNPNYDFSNTLWKQFVQEKANEENITFEKAKNKYYKERVFNIVMEKNYGFENKDRDLKRIENEKYEEMDLYKDKTMIAVKIGSTSSKLCYAIDQITAAAKQIKHSNEKTEKIENVVVWFVLDKNELPMIDGKPDLDELHLLVLKNKLDAWKKEIRLLGYKPKIYINYWKAE